MKQTFYFKKYSLGSIADYLNFHNVILSRK